MPINQTELGRRLGLSKSQVSKLAARGMPTHDVTAADQWRRENVMQQWRKSAPRQPETSSARVQTTAEGYEALKHFWTEQALSAWAFDPVVIAMNFSDAGIEDVTAEQVLRLAKLQLNTIMEFACLLMGDDDLVFRLPEWACADEIDREYLLMQIDEALGCVES